MATILVTGSAGFIGFFLSRRLLSLGHEVIGIDEMNDYYDVELKKRRNNILIENKKYTFIKQDFSEYDKLVKVLKGKKIDMIFHIGAQAGVRYSLENPFAYLRSNELGTLSIFEYARHNNIKRVVFASSSSVYGGNDKYPFSEEDKTDKPVSLYAMTKKANELMAHTYHHLYGIEMIGVRFFTVYGPYMRPDLALFKFVKKIIKDEEIPVYNNGNMERDFTYVEDIVDGLIAAMNKKNVSYSIYNLGGENPVKLGYMIELIEKSLDKKANKRYLGMQPGDVLKTAADITKAKKELGFMPKTPIEKIIPEFCDWFVENEDWLLKLKDGKQ